MLENIFSLVKYWCIKNNFVFCKLNYKELDKKKLMDYYLCFI